MEQLVSEYIQLIHTPTELTPDKPTPILRSLGTRLKHIFDWSLSAGPYTDIWDLCCDHGRLGLHLHQASALAGCNIHLIDRVPSVIDTLDTRYGQLLGSHLSFTCMDASELVLPNSGNHLVIVAGVGGQTVATILQNITQRLQGRGPLAETFSLEYILSPNLDTFELRRSLRSNNVELLAEEFVSEKGWHHEHMHLRYHSREGDYKKSSVAGESLWQPLTDAKKRYLERYIRHYDKCLNLRGDDSAAPALAAYADILAKKV